MVERMSVGSFVSVHGDEFRDTSPTSTEAVVSESCGTTEKGDLSSHEAEETKSETLDYDWLSIGSNCSDSS